MAKALIFEGVVVQIEVVQFPVAPALIWVDIIGVIPAPEVGWSYDGTTFTAPPAPPLPPVLTPRQKIIDRLRRDPILKAQVIDSFEARGITNKQTMLDALVAKFADVI